MATVSTKRDARIDMRMTGLQRDEIERAAAMKGMSITQWALSNLIECARRDIQEETTTRLSARAFDSFVSALDDGMPREALDLLEREPVWSR